MHDRSIPLVILGGSDRKPGYLPPTGKDKHPLTGCKGVDIRIGDQPLIELLVGRFRQVELFDPIYVAGPAKAYAGTTTAEIIPTDASFGKNIGVGVETVRRRHAVDQMAIATCDILPEVAELQALLEDYRAHSPCDLWFPLVKAPADPRSLGASSWKPRYAITPPGGQPTQVLPNHIVIVDPEAMRLEFLYRLMDGAYSTRNRPILYRRSQLLRLVLLGLLWQDLLHLLSLRLPTLTWDVVRHGYVAARKLRDGVITQAELEDAIRHIFTKRRHRRRHPQRAIRMPILEGLSLARDIDTVEEARALAARAGDLEDAVTSRSDGLPA